MKIPIARFAGFAALTWTCLTAPLSSRADTVVTTTTTGMVSDASADDLLLRSESDAAPVKYVVSRETEYVDEKGIPVAASLVRAGYPVTVTFVHDGDRRLVRRVIVSKAAMPVAPRETVVERETSVARPPTAIEKKTYIEPSTVEPIDRGAYIDRPTVVKERVVVDPVVEKRIWVAPGTVIEKKTTTTTRTTER